MWARLFILDKQFKAAEGLYLEQNNLEAGFPEIFILCKMFRQNVTTKFRRQNEDALSSVYTVQINSTLLAEKKDDRINMRRIS